MASADAPTFALDPAPTAFGRYTLVARIAVGGMGEIFLARLPGVEGRAPLRVVKRLRPELANDPEFAARFRAEAQLLLQLQHGAITQVHDVGEVNGQSYIALEFVDGKDLGAILARLRAREERLPPALALHVLMRVLDALAYAHRKKGDDEQDLNLVHRDVSPPNVLVSYEGEVKVIDFGLAKSAITSRDTDPSLMVGKLMYMAPEFRHGAVDRRADLYSAAVVLHEALHGAHVLAGMAPAELLLRALTPNFPRLEGAVPGIPSGTDAVLQRALAAEPGQRYRTAEELRAALAPLQLAANASAGPESLGALVRSLFSREYANERQQLKAARTGAPAQAGPRIDPTLRSIAFEEVRAVAPTAPFPVIGMSPGKPSLVIAPQAPGIDPTFIGRAPSAPTEPGMPALELPAQPKRAPGRAATAGEVPVGGLGLGLELPSNVVAAQSQETIAEPQPLVPQTEQVTDVAMQQDNLLAKARVAGRRASDPVVMLPSPPTVPEVSAEPDAPPASPPAPQPSTEPAPVPLERPRRASTGARSRPQVAGAPGVAPAPASRPPQPSRPPAHLAPTEPPANRFPWMLLVGILSGALLALGLGALLALHR